MHDLEKIGKEMVQKINHGNLSKDDKWRLLAKFLKKLHENLVELRTEHVKEEYL